MLIKFWGLTKRNRSNGMYESFEGPQRIYELRMPDGRNRVIALIAPVNPGFVFRCDLDSYILYTELAEVRCSPKLP